LAELQAYTEHHGALDAASDGRHAFTAFAQRLLYALSVTYVAFQYTDICPSLFHLGYHSSGYLGFGSGSRHGHDILGAVIHHPLQHAATQTSKAADDKVGSVILKVFRSLRRIYNLFSYG
jgi:hypothetical protein